MTVARLGGDIAAAEAFAIINRGEIRYSTAHGWLIWSGSHWEPDRQRGIQRRAKEAAKAIFGAAVDSEDAKGARDAARLAAKARLDAMVSLAESEPGLSTHPDAFDKKPFLLATLSGTVDLRTGELRDANPEDLITKRCAAFVARGTGSHPKWDAFLSRILAGNVALLGFVQRLLGHALCGQPEHILPIFFGAGANGKTTLVEILRGILGSYAQTAPASVLMRSRDESARSDVARLRGVRLVMLTETAEGRALDEALVKSLTGGDTVTARKLYRDFEEFKPEAVFVLATNHRPRVEDTSHAMWRRLRLVPFTVTIPADEQNPNLARELIREEGAGILRWLIDGALAWQRDGLRAPDVVMVATATYRSAEDLVGRFVEDRCEIDQEAEGEGLWPAFQEWCKAAGERCPRARDFGERLRERGLRPAARGRRRAWLGIRLREGAAADDPSASVVGCDGYSVKSLREIQDREVTENTIPTDNRQRTAVQMGLPS